MKFQYLVIVVAAIALSGCSVAMASKKKGVSVQEAMNCQTRSCFLTLRDATVMTTANHPDGSMSETYKILLEQGSTGRAVMHGLLDVATLGIWEVAGTPIEGSAGKDQYTIITANYDGAGKLTGAMLGDRAASATTPVTATPATVATPVAAPDTKSEPKVEDKPESKPENKDGKTKS
jgi:hypothetical protein